MAFRRRESNGTIGSAHVLAPHKLDGLILQKRIGIVQKEKGMELWNLIGNQRGKVICEY
jgi:hypothetical protein